MGGSWRGVDGGAMASWRWGWRMTVLWRGRAEVEWEVVFPTKTPVAASPEEEAGDAAAAECAD